MLTLSICIPSYNRFEKLGETLKKILEANSTDFEVVIVDNCSPRPIEEFIKIDDSRLRVIKRETCVYGTKSVGDAVLFGKGKYSMLLLDKDVIDSNGLEQFIHVLQNNDVAGGYCEINTNKNKVEIIKTRTVERFGYLSKHPSGDFYKIDLLREYANDMSVMLAKDPFPFDIYLAYCASKGDMMLYNAPCIYSDATTGFVNDVQGSITFNKSFNNMYYFPSNRDEEYMVYIRCLNDLEIDRESKMRVAAGLYERTLVSVTTIYRYIMRCPSICRHYHHDMEEIGLLKMIKYAQNFRKVYYDTNCMNLTVKEKKSIERHAIKSLVLRALKV